MSIANLFVNNGFQIKCASLECKTFNVGNVNTDDLVVTNNAEVQNNLEVTGTTTLSGDVTLDNGANLEVDGTLRVTGASTFDGGVNGLLLTAGGGQTLLTNYYFVEGTLTVSGALTAAEWGDVPYRGIKINNHVTLYIDTKAPQNAVATANLILSGLDANLRPEAPRLSTIDVKFNLTTVANALVNITQAGQCIINSSQGNSNFVDGQACGLNYPTGLYTASLSYFI